MTHFAKHKWTIGKLIKKKIIRAKIAKCSRVATGYGKTTYVKPKDVNSWLKKLLK